MTGFSVSAPARNVVGELEVPGDKSITHRALLLSLIGTGTITITNPSPAADCAASAAAVAELSTLNPHLNIESFSLSTLGVDRQIVAQGSEWVLDRPLQPLDVGNSGTTIRLMSGIGAASDTSMVLTGDSSIRRRPMARVVEPLLAMGADIRMAEGGVPPLEIRGRQLNGVSHVLKVASAQVKSALLLAGLRATGVTTIAEPHRSRDHTERMLRYMGVPVSEDANRLSVKSTNLRLRDVHVPGDLSSAAPLLAAAAVLEGSDLLIRGVGVNPTRTGFLEILRSFGAVVDVTSVKERCGEPVGDVRIRCRDRRPVSVGGSSVVDAIDELPLVAILGAAAEGETVVKDAAELRVKESDRIDAITRALAGLGVDITATPDGFRVRGTGARLAGGTIDAMGDHRIAMAGAIAGLMADEPVRIDGWDSIAVSYPGFGHDLDSVVVR